MLSEVVDKEAFCPRGCSKALGGGKAHSVPKHWFVELVKAIRVLVRPQGPSERNQGAWALFSLSESSFGGSASA